MDDCCFFNQKGFIKVLWINNVFEKLILLFQWQTRVLLSCIALATFLTGYTIEKSQISCVMQHNLAAYTWEDEDWPNESFSDYLYRCMRYQGYMQPFKKCKIAWGILGRYYNHISVPNSYVLDNDLLTWQNLQLLCGEQENPTCYVANLVDRTVTEIGHVTLRSWIAQPTDDVQVLLARQMRAKFLIENEEVFNDLNRHMQVFKESEDFLLSFWHNDPLKHAASRHYFTMPGFKSVQNFLNNNETVLGVSAVLEHQKRILSFLTIGFAAAYLPVCGAARFIWDMHESSASSIAQRLVATGGPLIGLFSFIENYYMQSTVFMAAGFYCGMKAQGEFDWMYENFILSKCLQTKLWHVARCLNAIQEISNIVHTYPDLQSIVDEDMSLSIQRLKATNPSVKRLYQLFNSDTFKKAPSMFAHYGRILIAYQLMHDCKHELESLLCLTAELDVYMSIARLYKEFEHERVSYSFPFYSKSINGPSMVVKDMWNPFVNPGYVVPNSIELGGINGPCNAIITGPNEGGKSTFARGLTVFLILAQSIALVPGKGFLTPFSYIVTYSNITDDHGKSLFEAQAQRAKHILDHIDNLEPHKYGFVVIDELFNGTDARIGEVVSYSVADYLCKKSNVISIFPTHFPLLTQLEKSGCSANYKVIAVSDEQGKISYPFILQKGISDQNVVLDILRNESFNDAIIDQATFILEEKAWRESA